MYKRQAIDNILEIAITKDWGIFTYCEKIMSRLEYSLNYLKEAQEKEVVYINSLAFKDPEKFIKEYLLI